MLSIPYYDGNRRFHGMYPGGELRSIRFGGSPEPQKTVVPSNEGQEEMSGKLSIEETPDQTFFPPKFPELSKQTTEKPAKKKGFFKRLFENLFGPSDPQQFMTPLEKDLFALMLGLNGKREGNELDLCHHQPIRKGEVTVSDRTYSTQIKDIKIGDKHYEFIRQDGKRSDGWSMDGYVLKSKSEPISLSLCEIGKQVTYTNSAVDFTMKTTNWTILEQARKFFHTLWEITERENKNVVEHENARKIKEAGGFRI